jgi:hypothetical protein
MLAARWRIVNIHRLEKDLVLTYRSGRLMKKLAERSGPGVRVVDGKSAYHRLNRAGESPMGLYDILTAMLAP